jgi:hypothetical protein
MREVHRRNTPDTEFAHDVIAVGEGGGEALEC